MRMVAVSSSARGRRVQWARSARWAAATVLAAGITVTGCASHAPPPPPPVEVGVAPTPERPPAAQAFTATAYSIAGRTASGRETHRGVVAADPAVLPIGTRIRIAGAGPYSGEYTVADTGRTVHGRSVDIYMTSSAEARRFGRQSVQVERIASGSGGAKQAGSQSLGHKHRTVGARHRRAQN
jgi:rare lipoprotein A